MSFSERVAVDPLGAVSACAIWIPIAIVFVTMIGWMISGEVETIFGLLTLCVDIGMGVLATYPPRPGLGPWLLAATVTSIVLFPMARAMVNRRALVAIDIEQIEKHYENLRQRPNDAGATLKLAEGLYVRGMPGQAIVLAERALQVLPKDAFREEHSMVLRWRASVRESTAFRPLACLHCGHVNAVGEIHCSHCGRPYLVDLAKGRWLGEGAVHQLLAVWVCLMFAFVGLPAAAQAAAWSVPLAATLVVGQVVLGCAVLVWAFRRGGHREAS